MAEKLSFQAGDTVRVRQIYDLRHPDNHFGTYGVVVSQKLGFEKVLDTAIALIRLRLIPVGYEYTLGTEKVLECPDLPLPEFTHHDHEIEMDVTTGLFLFRRSIDELCGSQVCRTTLEKLTPDQIPDIFKPRFATLTPRTTL